MSDLLPAAGDVYGKWRIVSLYEIDGEAWAVIQNTRNPQITNRFRVSDLEALKGSA